MADKLKHLRSNTPAARPTGMTANDAGRIWINMADKVGGFINDLGQAVAFTLGSGAANPPEVINLPGGTSGSKAGIGAAYDAFTPKPVGDVVFAQYGDEIYIRTGAGTADADWGFVGEPVVYSTVAEVLAATEERQAISPKALGDATRVNPSGVPADDAGRFIKLNASGQIDPGFVATAITDHKAEADPHTQYLTATEGNAAYEPLGTATVAASQAVLAHVQQTDPHTQYLTQAEGDALYAPAGALALPLAVASGGTGAATPQGALANLGAAPGENLIVNGAFDIWQRSTVQTTNGYKSADHWRIDNTNGTFTLSRAVFDPAVGEPLDNAVYAASLVYAGASAASDFIAFIQPIEDVKFTANRSITTQFRAYSASAQEIAVEFIQNFGTGGSTAVPGTGSQKVTIGPGWTYHTFTTKPPSVAGKTFGEKNNLSLLFWLSAGSTFNARTGSLGVKSGNIQITNVKVEYGTVATPFRRRLQQQELALCQRYYETGRTGNLVIANAAGQSIQNYTVLRVPKALAAPTVTGTFTYGNAQSGAISMAGTDSMLAQASSIAAGQASFRVDWACEAEL